MQSLKRALRAEPPLTAPRREPAGAFARIEPPLTAGRSFDPQPAGAPFAAPRQAAPGPNASVTAAVAARFATQPGRPPLTAGRDPSAARWATAAQAAPPPGEARPTLPRRPYPTGGATVRTAAPVFRRRGRDASERQAPNAGCFGGTLAGHGAEADRRPHHAAPKASGLVQDRQCAALRQSWGPLIHPAHRGEDWKPEPPVPAAAPPRAAAPAAPAAPAARMRPDAKPEPLSDPKPASDSLRRATARPRDPAPSRLSYRMHRLWLTPLFRAFFRVGVPAFAVVLSIGLYLSDDTRRAAIFTGTEEAIRALQERPEFMVNLMAIEGASPALGEAIRGVLPIDFPVSSFDLDLEAMRQSVAELEAVSAADLRIRPGGILEVKITERRPAILWRGPEGLWLLDRDGHKVTQAASRLERPDLAMIAGEGAEAAVPEALRLIEAAAPVAPRLRGLVRMGERRWDVVLDNGQRILLPEAGAVAALERVMALAEAQDMLARDVSVIDVRYEARPTLRLEPEALDAMRNLKAIETGANSG